MGKLLDRYARLVPARVTRRPPAERTQKLALAQTVARRLLIEKHREEYDRLYEQVKHELGEW